MGKKGVTSDVVDAVTGVGVKRSGLLTPQQLAKSGTEHGEQAALFCWAALQVKSKPGIDWMYAIPNGGERNRIVAGQMKAEGVKSGIHDVCLPVARGGYFGLYIEMKRADRGEMSDKQLDFQRHLVLYGYASVLAHGWVQAVNAIETYYRWPYTVIVGERMIP